METKSEAEIHDIVQRVLKRYTGSLATDVPSAGSPDLSMSQKELKTAERKVVAIGADHGGYEMKEALKPAIVELGCEIVDVGTNSKDAVDYPDFAHAVASMVGSGKAWRGIMIDGAGIGSCMVANKIPGVRAGMAYDISSASNGREHNDANVLTLGAGLIGNNLAKQIVKTWLTTEFGGGRHAGRVNKIVEVEKKYLK